MANALGWTWVVLGDGVGGAQRVRDALSIFPRISSETRNGAPASCWPVGWKPQQEISSAPTTTFAKLWTWRTGSLTIGCGQMCNDTKLF